MVALSRRRRRNRADRERPWALNAPGMPPPGPNFLAEALARGCESVFGKAKKGEEAEFSPGRILTRLYARALREPGFTMTVAVRPGHNAAVTFVPGHIWGQNADEWQASMADDTVAPPVDGPHRASVMVLGKMPWHEETRELRNLVGPSGEVLTDMVAKLHIKDARSWYVTNLVKFTPPEGTALKKAWIKDCLPLLHQELRIVRPKYILCLGADASKELLGSRYNVGYMEGRVVPYTYPVHRDHDDEPRFHTAQVMTILHPVEAAREQAKARIVERGMARFAFLVRGTNFDKAEEGIDHRLIETLEDAEEWIDEVNAEFAGRKLRDRLVAWDAEWQGQHPMNDGAYLRTVQASWAPKKAVCFKITHAGGKVAFRDRDGRPAVKRLMRRLQAFSDDKRAVGHFLVSDLEWLTYNGFDPTRGCRAPLDPEGRLLPWQRLRRGEGWLDTAMMVHAIEETAPLGLESLTARYTTAPRYDIPLEDWKKEYCKERGIKSGALEGYGEVDDDVLVPYALYDADVTLRIALELLPYLDFDYDGNCCWEPFWERMIIQPVILSIHQNGILVDRKQIDRLTESFLTARSAVEGRIKDWARWPNFNIRSTQHVREFLFGAKLNGKYGEGGSVVRIRPNGARSLRVEPLLDTSKPPRRWEDIKAKGQERQASPTTGKMVLAILAQDNPEFAEQINMLRDYRFLDQVLKSVLRRPKEAEGGGWLEDDDGNFEYEAGLAACIDDDGRVRTHLYPTAETGRWKSARPNLQNFCLDGDTEILTRRGWVRLCDLHSEEHVAQYWADGGSIDFVKPTSLVRQHHRGNLINVRTEDQVDLLVTPNHRCLVRRRKTGRTFEVKPREFVADCHHIHAGTYAGGQKSMSAAEVTWLCAVQADGSYVKNGGIKFGFTKRRKIERLRAALHELRVPFTEHSNGIYVGVTYLAAADAVATARLRLGDNKVFGAWLLDYDRRTLDLFAEEVIHWDGLHTGGTEYSSSDKVNADWVQIVWTLSGRRARMREYRPSNPNARLHHCVDRPKRPVDYSMTTNARIEEVPWNDKVYCVTVPSGFIVVRRNGKVSVTGNSKQRDRDYKRLLGDAYKRKLRSILVAPEGCALVEFDYTGAELYGMALMAGDATMIDHAQRALYPDSGFDEKGRPARGGKSPHPKYYDIHSNVAVLAFQLAVSDHVPEKKDKSSKFYGKTAAEILGLPVGASCPANKFALWAIGKTDFRTLAKNVIFGIAYGRGAKAIALQATSEGVKVTADEAQTVIDAIFDMYPGLMPFFEEAKKRAVQDRWLCHCFGGFRRFIGTSDFKLEGEFERQAMNFPIQGMIASAVNRGLARLHHLIYEYGLQDDVKMLLQIHDAGLLEVKLELVGYVVEELIPYAMRDCVPIYPTTLDGVPTGEGPFYLGLETTVEKQWGGEKFSAAECERYGIPLKFADAA